MYVTFIGGRLRPGKKDEFLKAWSSQILPLLKKQDGRIDWTLPALDIWNRVRGLRPWPGAYTWFRGKNLHIWAATPPSAHEAGPLDPGTLIADRGRLRVACGGKTLLELAEIQLEGRKRLAARDFLNGAKVTTGETVE